MSDVAYVAQLPECDIHESLFDAPGVPAAYDGKTVGGPWANMCAECFPEYGVGLGTGRGQRLIVGEKPKPTKDMQRIALTAPYSEACMHLGVAGTPILVEPVPYGMAQLYTATGERISFPVTRGEAGLHPTEDRPLA